MSISVAISRLHFPVTTLGPGRRVGIWFQGCSIHCPGCISVDTWEVNRGQTTISNLMDAITDWIPSTDGFTISGGEPFDQPVALMALLQELRAKSLADILVFTGYSYEAVRPFILKGLGLIDALISDPFDENASQSLALRGSDNQQLHFLTPLGRSRFAQFERESLPSDLQMDVMFDDDGGVWFAGIPRHGDIINLRRLLSSDGHIISNPKDGSFPKGD